MRPCASCVRSLVGMGSVVVLANCLGMACILAARIGAPSRCATSTVIASSAIIDKAMSAPAVAVAPSSPRPHAQEYAGAARLKKLKKLATSIPCFAIINNTSNLPIPS